MRVQYEIANGHRRGENGLLEYLKSNPGTPKSEAIAAWVDAKFGTFIRTTISEDFTITSADENRFIVNFTYESDANDFIKQLGGHRLEE
ncbi:hypothetical protein J2Y48_002499 [Mycoplana sp. BE70]|uniref:hypothetical protein n=1 Tax=Mycoplana sp. BE70 TaxID=2817775 RepID=UPI002858814D|nr:hypothetical protein [Mycoplana sp. BE70]MDR6757203.1 hypothetical protein [Mycoplana sp. BE70]